MLGTSGLSTVQVRQAPKTLPGTKAGVPLAVKYALGPADVSATVPKVSLIPAPPLPFGDLLGRTVLSAAVVTVKRRRARSPKWKVRGKVPGGPGTGFQRPLPVGHRARQLRTVTARVTCCLPGELMRDPVPRRFTGGRPRRQPLPGTYLHSRPSAYTACLYGLGPVSPSYQLWEWWEPS